MGWHDENSVPSIGYLLCDWITPGDKRRDCTGKVYFDEQNYIYCTTRQELWKKLTIALHHAPYPPQELTLPDLRRILNLLGIDYEPTSV